jgi:acetyltransferase-like isoleucine patch superfamily enzyme
MNESFFKRIIKLIIREYVANNIIPRVPSVRLRTLYYRSVLGHDIGVNAKVLMGCYIYNSKLRLKIGQNTVVNQNCILDPRGGLVIGRNVNISRSVAIYTAGHLIDDANFSDFLSDVVIGDLVWIGGHSILQPGVRIGRGAVVLPGSVVTRSVEEFQVVGGVPARVVGTRPPGIGYEINWDPIFL